MKRMLAVLAVGIGALGLTMVAMTGGAGVAGPRVPVTTDIAFREGVCSNTGAHCETEDAGTNPESFGTRLIFTIPLFSGGSRIGFEQGECVNLHKTSKLYHCAYELHFKGGSVSVQGALHYDGKAGTIAVTGGLGSYEGAYGHLHELAGFPARYQLHIVTP